MLCQCPRKIKMAGMECIKEKSILEILICLGTIKVGSL